MLLLPMKIYIGKIKHYAENIGLEALSYTLSFILMFLDIKHNDRCLSTPIFLSTIKLEN